MIRKSNVELHISQLKTTRLSTSRCDHFRNRVDPEAFALWSNQQGNRQCGFPLASSNIED